MKRFIPILALALVLAGCYKDDLKNLHNDLEQIRDVTIPQLSAQVGSISSSIDDLNALNAKLQAYVVQLKKTSTDIENGLKQTDASLAEFNTKMGAQITASHEEMLSMVASMRVSLENQMTEANQAISVLDAKGDALQLKIDGLKDYMDGLYARRDWAEGTLATLAVQDSILTDIEAVKYQIELLSMSTEELNKTFQKVVEEAYKAFNAETSEEIVKAFKDVTTSYQNSINAMVEKINDENSKAIVAAVSKSEQDLIAWVNVELKDYLTIAAANSQIEALKAIVGAVPEGTSIQAEIEKIQADLATAKQDIKAAYEKAVKDAVEANEAKLREEMSQKIAAVRADIVKLAEGRVAELLTKVSALKEEVSGLTTKIKSVEDQMTAILKSISDMETFKNELDKYIKTLETELQNADKTNREKLEGFIEKLTKSADDLQKKINDLKAYVGTIPQGSDAKDVATWINTTFTNLQASFDNYYKLSEIQEILDGLNKTLGTHTKQLSDLNSELDKFIADMKRDVPTWISTKLSSYYTAAEIDAKIKTFRDALDKKFSDKDDSLLTVINSYDKKFSDEVEKLTKKYQDLISNALKNEGGYITTTIKTAINGINGNISTYSTSIGTLESDVNTLMSRIDNFEGMSGRMKNSVDSLKRVLNGTEYASLKALVDDYDAKVAALGDTYANKKEFDALYAQAQVLIANAQEINGLVGKMTAVSSSIEKINTFFAGYLDKNLADVLKTVTDAVAALNGTVFGESGTQLQDKINVVKKALYGDGMDPKNPSADSILGLIASITNKLLADSFSSITYVPKYLNQKEVMSYNSGGVSGTFEFIVKPSSLAALANTSKGIFDMHFVSGGKEYSFQSTNVSGSSDGTITVSVSDSRSAIFDDANGVSAALYVNGTDATPNFTSKYIPISISGNSKFYADVSRLLFAAGGETKYVNVVSDGYFECSSYPAEWIEVSPEEASGNKTVSVWAHSNTSKASRRGNLVLTNSSGKTLQIYLEQNGCRGLYSPSFPSDGKVFKSLFNPFDPESYKATVALVNDDSSYSHVYISKRATFGTGTEIEYMGVTYDDGTKTQDFPYTKDTAIELKNMTVTLDRMPVVSSFTGNTTTITFTAINPENGEEGSSLTLTIVRNWII